MRRVAVVACLASALIGAGVMASAQAVQTVRIAQVAQPDPVPPAVLSGSEIGFRMVGRAGDKAVGTLVVRVDGRWVEVEFKGGVRPIVVK